VTRPHLALPHGTLPADRSRSVALAHDGFVTSGTASSAVRDVVLASWQRSRELGVDPDAVLAPVDLEGAALEEYRQAHPLAAVTPVIRRLLVEDAAETDLLVAVSDEVGRLLWVEGAPGLRSRAEAMNFLEGARWSEDLAGTNAPGTALALDRGVQIFSHEHYSRIVQPWSCTAAPIHDPVSGRIVGVLDVTGGDIVATPQSMALVQAAVHAVETELRLQALIVRPSGPIRRSTRNTSLTRRLDVLGVDHAVLHVGDYSRALSQRHSEILLLLAVHPQGLTAEQLAVELHVDDLPLVTVRAEMSRLRGVLGDLAPESRPYRLPHPIETDAALLDGVLRSGDVATAVRGYRGAVLPHSEAPGVVRIRGRLHERVRATVLGSADIGLLLEWGEGLGSDDPEVWTAALRLMGAGSPQHALARMRLAALDDEFGIPAPR